MDGLKAMWTNVSTGVVKMPNNITLLFADRCGTDVRRRARGGGGGAAIAADHRQFPAM